MRAAFALGSIVFMLAGCDVRKLYGIEVVDLPKESISHVVRKDDYALYLSGINNSDRPGLYVIAESNDRADPGWDWEDYQEWPAAVQAARFAEYYEGRYLDVTVAGISRCTFDVETFDHADSAREAAYGRWLHDMGDVRPVDELAKGMLVRIPVSECEKRGSGPQSREVELTLLVGDQDETTITIRVEFLDAWFDWWLI